MKNSTAGMNATIRCVLLFTMVLAASCKDEPVTVTSTSSPFYSMIAGTYYLEFNNERTRMPIHLNADSTFRIDSYSTAREYVAGKWFLSDSLLLIDFVDAGWIGCLFYENVHNTDTTGNVEWCFKLTKIDSAGFDGVQIKKNKIKKKSTVKALRATF